MSTLGDLAGDGTQWDLEQELARLREENERLKAAGPAAVVSLDPAVAAAREAALAVGQAGGSEREFDAAVRAMEAAQRAAVQREVAARPAPTVEQRDTVLAAAAQGGEEEFWRKAVEQGLAPNTDRF